MEKIASFNVDHRYIKEGVYISRIDGDITTYDLRMRKPNTDNLMTNAEIHSFEHLFATLVRNSKIGSRVIYSGPMGCQTGFYLLVRDSEHEETIEIIKETLEKIIDYKDEMPGFSEIECGNYRNLSVDSAKKEAEYYLEKIRDIDKNDLEYPTEEK